MPAVVWAVLLFVGIPIALFVVAKVLIKRSLVRWSSDGAIAEQFADVDTNTFAFEVPAHAATLGIYAEYTVDEDPRVPGSREFGLVLRVDVERADFSQRGEYLINGAGIGFGEVPVTKFLDASVPARSGITVRRTLLIARVPPGDALRVSGKVKRSGGERHTLHVFAKPEPPR